MLRALAIISSLTVVEAMALDYPESRCENTSDNYHGIRVADPYQWLEDWDSGEVKTWSREQNTLARRVLDALPGRAAIARDIEAVTVSDTVSYYAGQRIGGKAWFMKYAPPKQQPVLVELSPDGNNTAERVVFDPSSSTAEGTTSIEWFSVSPDAKLVAIALTEGGAEVADLYLYDLASGEGVDQVLPRVNGPTAGGEISWDADSAGFYYTRYPREGEKPEWDQNFYQQLWHRKLGTPLSRDRYELGREFARINQLRVRQHLASSRVLVTTQYGDSGRFALHLRDAGGRWHQLSQYEDAWIQGEFIDGDTLLVLSRDKAPRGKFITVDISALPAVTQRELVAESAETLASDFYGSPTFIVHNQLIYAKTLAGGPEALRVFDLAGNVRSAPAMELSGVGQLLPWGEDILIRQSSYLAPSNWLEFDGEKTARHPLSSTSSVRFDGYEVIREFATSADGTRVPVNILLAEGTPRDGSHPLLLTGYGGYGISLEPGFSPTTRIWLDQGGIFAEANLRGGGEYGETWHREGMLENKQNVFDDFHAVMTHLVQRGYTRKDKLAIEGGSNGGLLMGAMITQHPADFRVTVSHVGIYDSLRSELSPNGAFNIPEFGTVQDPSQFAAMRAYSPYHNVEKAAYPAILFMTGENDGRVDPMHSRKMTAALQAANTSDKPILLRTSGKSGHGSGTPLSEGIAQQVDRWAFLFHNLGIEYKVSHRSE